MSEFLIKYQVLTFSYVDINISKELFKLDFFSFLKLKIFIFYNLLYNY